MQLLMFAETTVELNFFVLSISQQLYARAYRCTDCKGGFYFLVAPDENLLATQAEHSKPNDDF